MMKIDRKLKQTTCLTTIKKKFRFRETMCLRCLGDVASILAQL